MAYVCKLINDSGRSTTLPAGTTKVGRDSLFNINDKKVCDSEPVVVGVRERGGWMDGWDFLRSRLRRPSCASLSVGRYLSLSPLSLFLEKNEMKTKINNPKPTS